MEEAGTATNQRHEPVGQDARDRDARRYITTIRPVVTALGGTAAVLDLSFGPRSVAIAELTAVAVLLVTILAVTGSMRAGWLPPRRAIFFALAGDFAAIATMVVLIPHPELAACTFALLAPLLGYFASARATITTCAIVALGIALGGPLLDDWNDPTVLPWASFVLLGTAITSAFVCARMRATERALEQRAAAERAARQRLEQVDRSRERLIANVSHELRTPLTSTIGAVDTLLRTDVHIDDTMRGQLLLLARDGGLRLLSLVEDLLTLGATRPDSLRLTLQAEPLSQLVDEAIAGISTENGRAIVVESAATTAVTVDRQRMIQVICNLVTNGLHHGAGDVIVSTDSTSSGVTIRVDDTGPGVPPEHLDELFLPFARFSTRSDSTGLGLAISRTIVEAHGGTLRYERTADQHTQFVVELPPG